MLRNLERTEIERTTYNILEWLGDIGGLSDAMYVIGGRLVGPISAIALNTELLVSLFRRKEVD